MDIDRKCSSKLDNHCACQRCRPHLVQDVRSSLLTSLGEHEYYKRSLIIFEPLWSCFITQFEQNKLPFCFFLKVGPLELFFFFKESLWMAAAGKNPWVLFRRTIWLKKGQIRWVYLIKDILLHCIFDESWLCFWMAGKNPLLFMFSFKAFEP